MIRRRVVQTKKQGNGQACIGKDFEVEPCTKECTGGCPTPVDCVLKPWNAWGDCQIAARKRNGICSGEQTRTRDIQTPSKCGGKVCDVQYETRPCDEPCDSNTPPSDDPQNPGSGGGVDPNTPGGGGGGQDPNNPGGNDGGGVPPATDAFGRPVVPNKVVVDPGGDIDSDSGLSTGVMAAIIGGSVVCCLIIVALLVVAACLLLSGGSAAPAGAAVAQPAQDQGVHGNPLFYAQEQKAYNPLFYASGTGSGGAGGGVPLVSAPGSGNYASAGMPIVGTMDAGASGAYGQGESYAERGGNTFGTADSGMFAAALANTCPMCQQAYPTAEDLDHHVKKRHGDNYAAYAGGAYPSVAGAAGGAYPSSASGTYPSSAYPSAAGGVYPSGRVAGTGAALDGGLSAYPSSATNYPSTAGYGAGVPDGIHTCDVCQKNYPSAADLAQHKSLRH